MIPKIIHYCWLSNDPVPMQLQQYMQTWREKLPGYEFLLWNFDRFDIRRSTWVKEAFEAKKYAFAADYIRLYAVYRYGGIYMDMDVEVVRGFDELLDAPLMLGKETDQGIEAGVFGAERGHHFLKQCLDYYEGRHFIKPDGSMDTRTLPVIMFEALKCSGYADKVKVYPAEYLTAKSHQTGKITATRNTRTIHHFAGSWVSSYQKLKMAFVRFIGQNNTRKLVKLKSQILRRRKS